jgi:DNA-binding CsgD family transcriptional regulator
MSLTLSPTETSLLTRVIECLGSDQFAASLLELTSTLVEHDSAVMMAYPTDGSLVVLHDALDAGDRAGFDGPYRNGLYMLSPLYIEAHAGRRGCFHISEIAPAGFTESEFYQLYYSTNDSIDQMAFLLETSNSTPLVLSLERTTALPAFDASERARLAAFTSLFVALLQQQRWSSQQVSIAAPQPDMHAHLQRVLDRFGSSVLTPREREVVRLILRGFPSKSVARELSISIQTEQVHRKNIYQKLSISSHAELFSLFFDAIRISGTSNEDPLLTLRA